MHSPKLARVTGRLLRNDEGSALVEFALAIPILLTMMFGVVELGRMAYTQSALYYAAQEATRYAIVRNGNVTDAELERYAAERLIGIEKNLAVLIAESPKNLVTDTTEFTVRVTFDYRPILPLLPSVMTLSASSSGFVAFG